MARLNYQWWRSVRALNDWAHGVDWASHLDEANRREGLTGKRALSLSIPGWPPAWFTGHIEKLQSREWILVVSLNPAAPSPEHYSNVGGDSNRSWEFWCNHNRHSAHWNNNQKFFPRLAELARRALPPHISCLDDETIASEHMLLLEFCPYASKKLPWSNWESGAQQFADQDFGMAINRQIRQLAFLHGQPKIALAHGRFAIYDVKDHQAPDMKLETIRDAEFPTKSFDLWTGTFQGASGSTPVLGFPFFREQQGMPTVARRIESVGERIELLTTPMH